jgi:hypothetical protein
MSSRQYVAYINVCTSKQCVNVIGRVRTKYRAQRRFVLAVLIKEDTLRIHESWC